MKPLLAHTYEPGRIPHSIPVWVQPKLNGVRALAGTDAKGRWRFQSRDEIPWDYGVLEHLSKELEFLGLSKDLVLDGELYVHGWSLQRINGAVTPVRKSSRTDTALVQYHVFDVANHRLSFQDRMLELRWSGTQGPVRLVETHRLRPGYATADELYAKFVAQKYEGIMYRIGDCPYTRPKDTYWNEQAPPGRLRFWSDQDNRCWHLLKRKDWQDGEFLIVGFRRTVGEKGEPGFQLHCQTAEGRAFDVGSGLTHAEQDFYEQNDPSGKQVKVKYLTLSDDGIPLNPTILAIL